MPVNSIDFEHLLSFDVFLLSSRKRGIRTKKSLSSVATLQSFTRTYNTDSV